MEDVATRRDAVSLQALSTPSFLYVDVPSKTDVAVQPLELESLEE